MPFKVHYLLNILMLYAIGGTVSKTYLINRHKEEKPPHIDGYDYQNNVVSKVLFN